MSGRREAFAEEAASTADCPTWYHSDGFQGTEDTEGSESRDVPQVHKLGDVAAG